MHAYRDDEMEIAGPMTAEEYFAEARRASEKPRDARKAELIDGVLILFPSPLDVHERLYVFLLRLLGEYAEQERRQLPAFRRFLRTCRRGRQRSQGKPAPPVLV